MLRAPPCRYTPHMRPRILGYSRRGSRPQYNGRVRCLRCATHAPWRQRATAWSARWPPGAPRTWCGLLYTLRCTTAPVGRAACPPAHTPAMKHRLQIPQLGSSPLGRASHSTDARHPLSSSLFPKARLIDQDDPIRFSRSISDQMVINLQHPRLIPRATADAASHRSHATGVDKAIGSIGLRSSVPNCPTIYRKKWTRGSLPPSIPGRQHEGHGVRRGTPRPHWR
jgi:hypothetical protein